MQPELVQLMQRTNEAPVEFFDQNRSPSPATPPMNVPPRSPVPGSPFVGAGEPSQWREDLANGNLQFRQPQNGQQQHQQQQQFFQPQMQTPNLVNVQTTTMPNGGHVRVTTGKGGAQVTKTFRGDKGAQKGSPKGGGRGGSPPPRPSTGFGGDTSKPGYPISSPLRSPLDLKESKQSGTKHSPWSTSMIFPLMRKQSE